MLYLFTNFLHQNYFILLWNISEKGIIVLLNESVYIGILGHFVFGFYFAASFSNVCMLSCLANKLKMSKRKLIHTVDNDDVHQRCKKPSVVLIRSLLWNIAML